MITGLFDIALNSIKVAQIGLEISGNNVANMETSDYTRRSLIIDQLPHNKGSVVKGIKREYNNFVGSSWQDAVGPVGYYKIKDQILTELEGIFNELNSEGIKPSLVEFWNAWEMITNDSSDLSLRENLIQKARVLINNIHIKKKQLHQLRSYLDPEIKSLLEKVNNLTQRLAELNSKIRFGKTARRDINELLDERDKILRELSENIGSTSIKDKNGQVIVLLEGQALVIENQAFSLNVNLDDNGNLKIIWNNEVDITCRIELSKKGKLSAYIEMRDKIIPDYAQKIDIFTNNLANTINAQHTKGYDLDGNLGDIFFKFDPNNPADTIDLNINNPKKIAASLSDITLPSDNRNALAILAFRDQSISELNGHTFDSFYNSLISDIGNKSYANKNALNMQNKIVDNIKDYFDSISGINLDEEAVNTIKFQYMYTASAKLISVANKILDTIISIGV